MSDDIARVKDALQLAPLIEEAGVELKRFGATKAKGLCPLHTEKTPSFIVDTELQYFKCFGCGVSGDIYSFYQEFYRVDFREALLALADRAGIELSTSDEFARSVDKKTLRACLKEAWDFYRSEFDALTDNHLCVRYLTDRGFKRGDFEFGFANSDRLRLVHHLESKGFTTEAMEELGLITESTGRSLFFERLLLPFYDRSGSVVGFTGRTLTDNQRKYVNSPESPLFKKGKILFNSLDAFPAAKEAGSVFVCEGQFDVLAVREVGVPQVVASSGTAFTVEHGLTLSRLVGDDGRITFFFDGDEAGEKAALALAGRCPDVCHKFYVLQPPSGLDPCDLYSSGKAEELRRLLDSEPLPLATFLVKAAAKDLDLMRAEDRETLLDRLRKNVSSVRSNFFITAVQRELVFTFFFSWEEAKTVGGAKKAVSGLPVDSYEADSDYGTEVLIHLYALLLSCEKEKRVQVLRGLKLSGGAKTLAAKLVKMRPSEWDGDELPTVMKRIKQVNAECFLDGEERERQLDYLVHTFQTVRTTAKRTRELLDLKRMLSETPTDAETFSRAVSKVESFE